MNIVITGASSGIGKQIYDWFSSDSTDTVIGVGIKGPDIEIDLISRRNRERAVESILSKIDGIDVLVNNAGMLLLDEEENFQACLKMVDLNMIAVWDLTILLESYIKKRIINIASVFGITGEGGNPLYAATKAGVIALTKSFAKKYVSRGITVNCISPGFFKTDLVPGDTPRELVDRIPMKREATVDEIIPVVEMLISSDYITGTNIVIDGGLRL